MRDSKNSVLPSKNLVLLSILFSIIILGGVLGLIQLGFSDKFLSYNVCNEKINESFINGTRIGGEYTLAVITNEVIQCKTVPISYAGYNYTLVAVECLNLTKSQEVK